MKLNRIDCSTPSSGNKINVQLPHPVDFVIVCASDGGSVPVISISAVLFRGDSSDFYAGDNWRANGSLSSDGLTFTYWGDNNNISMICSVIFP